MIGRLEKAQQLEASRPKTQHFATSRSESGRQAGRQAGRQEDDEAAVQWIVRE